MVITDKKVSENTFLFLIDFSIESLQSLTYLINFVKTTGGEIELLYAFEKLNFLDETNAQSVLIDLKEKEHKIERKLIALKEIIEVENIPVKTAYTFGDLQLEVNLKRKVLKDKLVVVIDAESEGKIKESTKFLINNYIGSVLIINSSSKMNNGNSIILSGDSDSLNECDLRLTNTLCNQLNTPLIVLESVRRNESKSFTYSRDTKFDVYYNPISESKTLIDLKKYITNNSIRLLGICREKTSKSLIKKFFHTNKSLLEIVKNINTPILILNNK
jgi:hypothetical protein